jgi:hypothetical protein
MLVPLEVIIKVIYWMTAQFILHHWFDGSAYIRYWLFGFLYKKVFFEKEKFLKF